MSTARRQYKPYNTFIKGVDVDTPVGAEDINGTLSECLNGEIVSSDIVKTRPGITPITTTKSNYIIREGIEYVKSDGTKENIVYLESTTLTGNSGILGRINVDTIDTIQSSLPDGIKPTLVQARSLLFIFTGISDKVYDGTIVRQIGIDYPTVKPTLHAHLAGDLNADGSYLFLYTYYNTVTGAESSPSLASDTLDAESVGGITIKINPGNSSTADKIKIYRTVSGGSIFFLDGETTISSTVYPSTASDSALGQELELDNSRLPEAAKYAVLSGNRLFVAGFASNKNRIFYSKVGINGSMYESFQIADFCDCNINDGDIIIGLGSMGSRVGVLKQRSVGKLLSLDEFIGGLERSGSTKFLYKNIPDEATSVNNGTIFNTGDKMGWLGKDNIYLTDGTMVVRIANRIVPIIRNLNFNQSYKFSAIVKSDTQQVIISVVRAGQSEPDYQIVGHFKHAPTIGWTFFSPGPNPSTHPGIPSASLWQTTVNNETEIYIGSSNSDGKVYQYGLGDNDYDYPIYFRVKLQWEDFKDAVNLKSFHSYKYLASTAAASPNNILYNTWEEDGRELVVKTETATVATSTKWGTSKWNTFKWARLIYSLIRFYPNRKSYLGRLGFYNDKVNSPMAIKAIRALIRPLAE